MDFLKATSPILALLLLLALSFIHSKTFIFTVPIFATTLFIASSNLFFVSIFILILWILYIFGNFRATGFAIQTVKFPTFIYVILFSISIVFVVATFYYIYLQGSFPLSFRETILPIILSILFSCYGTFMLFRNLICPLFVLRKEQKVQILSDYFIVGKNKSSYRIIKFGNDSFYLDYLSFRKFKGKVGVDFSYTVCHCLLGVTYICNIKQIGIGEGEFSNWDISLQNNVLRKKLIRVIFILLAVSVICFLFIVVANLL